MRGVLIFSSQNLLIKCWILRKKLAGIRQDTKGEPLTFLPQAWTHLFTLNKHRADLRRLEIRAGWKQKKSSQYGARQRLGNTISDFVWSHSYCMTLLLYSKLSKWNSLGYIFTRHMKTTTPVRTYLQSQWLHIGKKSNVTPQFEVIDFYNSTFCIKRAVTAEDRWPGCVLACGRCHRYEVSWQLEVCLRWQPPLSSFLSSLPLHHH